MCVKRELTLCRSHAHTLTTPYEQHDIRLWLLLSIKSVDSVGLRHRMYISLSIYIKCLHSMLVFIAWMIDWLVSFSLILLRLLLPNEIKRYAEVLPCEYEWKSHFIFNLMACLLYGCCLLFAFSKVANHVVYKHTMHGFLMVPPNSKNVQTFRTQFYWLSILFFCPRCCNWFAIKALSFKIHWILIATTSDLFRIKWL